MFKNLQIIRLKVPLELMLTADALGAALGRNTFEPPAATVRTSLGFVPPRGLEHGPLVESINGQWIVKLQVAQRNLPSDVVAKRVTELADKIEEQTGRRPGKRALKDLKEQATLELLPQAFTRTTSTMAWIDPLAGLLLVDSSSPGRADAVVSGLVRSVDQLALHRLSSVEAPSTCMAAWLLDGQPPAGFTIDREGELRSEDEARSVVRYERHTLDTDEVRQHLQHGMRPTKLAFTWRDRVSFVLTDDLQLRKLELLDLVFEGRGVAESDEQFDADVAIFTGEMSNLIPELIEALGGEMQLTGTPAVADAQDHEAEEDETEGEPA